MTDPTRQRLDEQLGIWRHNRKVFPGWLIAPEPVRDRVWENTRSWVEHYRHLGPAADPVQELDGLFELNWRLEVALVPLGYGLMDIAARMEAALASINPFPADIGDLPEATLILSGSTIRKPWSLIRQQWLAIAFGLLRYYREEHDFEKFSVLEARVTSISDLEGDGLARCCYERCLLSFETLEDEAAVRALGRWPNRTEDSFWMVRKAAVMAEAGFADQALEIAVAGLVSIRTGLADAPEHIYALSREGWAMWIIWVLQCNRHFRQGRPPHDSAELAEMRRRFLQLKAYGCSPDELREYFEAVLDQPAPQPAQRNITTPAFHPGTCTETIRMGDDFAGKMLAAYQCCRMAEEAAQPPSLGRISVSNKLLKQAAEWFQEFEPARTRSLILRARDEKSLNQYFSRHRIASMELKALDRLESQARRGIESSLRDAPTAVPVEDDLALRASHRLRCAVDLLARILIRKPEPALDDLWQVADRLYREPAVRLGLAMDSHLGDLYTNLGMATPTSALALRLPTLFGFPIGGEAEFPVLLPDHWPDPASISSRRFSGVLWTTTPRGWGNLKRRLFSLAAGETSVVKRTAFFRLIHLSALGCLSNAEGARLAGIFWRAAGNPPTLPVTAYGPASPLLALVLPNYRGNDSVEIVRQQLLDRMPGAVHPGLAWPEEYFDLIRQVSEPLWDIDQEHPWQRYVVWASGEVARIFQAIRSWWETSGKQLVDRARSGGWWASAHGGLIHRVLLSLWDVVRMVIVPRITRRQSTVSAITALIDEISSLGLPVGAVLPVCLELRTNDLQEVSRRLRRELANPHPGFFLSAMRGIVYWTNRTVGGRNPRSIPKVPVDLLQEVSTAVAVRRPDVLSISLDCAYNVACHLSDPAVDPFVRNLLIGLEYLITETTYREKSSPSDRYHYAECPRIRWQAARLAICLSRHGFSREPIVVRWLEAVAEDSLPEIRHLATDLSGAAQE